MIRRNKTFMSSTCFISFSYGSANIGNDCCSKSASRWVRHKLRQACVMRCVRHAGCVMLGALHWVRHAWIVTRCVRPSCVMLDASRWVHHALRHVWFLSGSLWVRHVSRRCAGQWALRKTVMRTACVVSLRPTSCIASQQALDLPCDTGRV